MGNELRTSFLKHTPIGKKTQKEPRTAAAHLRYISRLQATDYVEARHMPKHYWAAQGFLNEREFRIRANGRVCDKLVLVYPRGFRMDHAVEATRGFMDTVSKGRTPYYFTLQNFTDATENPHAHIIFVDEDVYGRKRVFRTSDLNSTDRLKDAWEKAANDVLEREGYAFRLDREAVKDLKREKANENIAAPPEPDALTHHLPEMAPEDHARAPVPDMSEGEVAELPRVVGNDGIEYYRDDRLREWRAVNDHLHAYGFDEAESIPIFAPPEALQELEALREKAGHYEDEQPEGGAEPSVTDAVKLETVQDRVRSAYQWGVRAREASDARSTLLSLRRDYAAAVTSAQDWDREAERTMIAHSAAEGDVGLARMELTRHSRANGKLKGFNLLGWKSPGRREAEAVRDSLEAARYKEQAAHRAHAQAFRSAQKEATAAAEAKATLQRYELDLAEHRLGSIEEINAAESLARTTQGVVLDGVHGREVVAAFEAGEISWHEAREALSRMPDSERYVAMLGQEPDQSDGIEI